MGTFTLSPTAIYKVRSSDRIITDIIRNNSTVLSTENAACNYIYEFDVSGISSHGPCTNIRLPAVIDRMPSSDRNEVQASWVRVKSALSIGNKLEYEFLSSYYVSSTDGWPWDKTMPSLTGDFDNKIYFQYHLEAYERHSSSSWWFWPDREFQFHGVTMTVTTGSDLPFEVTLASAGGYQSQNKDFTADINVTKKVCVRQHSVARGTIYYKETSASSYTGISFAGKTARIPAGTLGNNKTYDVYVTAVSDSGASKSTSTIRLSTVDGTAVETPVSPVNEVVYGDVTFRWNHSNTTGEPQKAYDLQISTNGGSSWTTIKSHIVTSETAAQYTQSASGVTYWRVRGYNQNDVAGSWSEAKQYINNVPPQPPAIREIAGAGRQTVRWSAEEQNAYQVKVFSESNELVYDTGEVYSTEMAALINEYLISGTYMFHVRIATAIGGWSDWAIMQKTVTASLMAPVFSVSGYPEGVNINITPGATFDRFYVLRNGELIGEVESSMIDYFVSGHAEYEVIGVNASDEYGYSFKSINFIPENNQIVTEDGLIFLVNKRWDNRSFPQRAISPKYSVFEYLGEKRPAHVFANGFKQGTITVTAYDESDNFEELFCQRVYLNTTEGWGEWCVVTAINRIETLFGNDTSLTLELTAGPGSIEYES